MQRRAKHLSGVLNHFWSKEYLLELRDAHRQRGLTSATVDATVGDVVMVKTILEDSAKIQELITGADGQTRGAILQLANRLTRLEN